MIFRQRAGTVAREEDTPDPGWLAQGDEQFPIGARGNPALTEPAIDRKSRAVGACEVLRVAGSSFRHAAVHGQGDIARRRFLRPDFELVDPEPAFPLILIICFDHQPDVLRAVRLEDLFRAVATMTGPDPLPGGFRFALGGALGQAGFEPGPLLDELVALRFEWLEPCRPLLAGSFRGDFARTVNRPRKCGGERVVIPLRERIELVIVTAGAPHRQPQERFARRPDHLIHLVGANLGGGDGILIAHVVIRTRHEKRRTDLNLRLILAHDIPARCSQDELVERLVIVQRSDHVIRKGQRLVMISLRS